MSDRFRDDYRASATSMAPLRRARVSSIAEEQLRRQIARGVWQPGTRLPSERQLALELRVSRASVREAIRGLEAVGVVEVRHGQGVFVRPPQTPETASFAEWASNHPYSIAELLAFRQLIEPQAAALAALHADRALSDLLESLLDTMDSAAADANLSELVRLDTAFHDLIAASSENRLYVDLLAHVSHLLRDSRHISLAVAGRASRVIASHRAIADAITRRDAPGAAQAMLAHLDQFSHDMGVRADSIAVTDSVETV